MESLGMPSLEMAIGVMLVTPLVLLVVSLRRSGLDVGVAGILSATPVVFLGVALTTGWIPPGDFTLPWLFFGAHLGVDSATANFLLLTGLLWLAASLAARGYFQAEARRSITPWWLASLLGNAALTVSLDSLTYFVFFAVMSFASYGLVVVRADAAAWRAGRIYISYVLAGEVILFIALALAAAGIEAGWAALGVGIGFGIKVGVIGLHGWLPLAHGAAPAPASAVLSGAMLKAGLLGWLRFFELPEGQAAASLHLMIPSLLMILGVSGALFGALAGLTQRDPKIALAYSSVSQMGLMVLAFGMSLELGLSSQATAAAIGLLAVHHALAKGALFLGVPLVEHTTGNARRIALGVLALPALALVGLAFTSGAVAKTDLKELTNSLPGDLANLTAHALLVCATGTALVMVRVFMLLPAGRDNSAGFTTWAPVLLLVAAGPVVAVSLPAAAIDAIPANFVEALIALATSLVPLIAALGLVWLWRALGREAVNLPAGDVVVLFERLVRIVGQALSTQSKRMSDRPPLRNDFAKAPVLMSLNRIGERFASQAGEASAVTAASVVAAGAVMLALL
jgi:hydrogenase-4 component B